MIQPLDRPLVGMRVLEVASGPMAAIGRQLAELGADVVRLEPPGGSADRQSGTMVKGVSLEFVAGNLGKRATTIDQLDRLVAEADVLIEDCGDLDLEKLRARHPALVIISVSPFGRIGPLSDWNGSEAVYHALSSELSRSGIPGREPLLPPGQLASACAAVQATYAALLCYYNALRTGRGDYVDFAILDGASQALDPGFGIAGSATSGIPASELPRGRPEARMLYPIIACKDGYVRLCVLAVRQWRGMFEWMGKPEEFADPAFDTIYARHASPTLIPTIAAFFADKTRAELEAQGEHFGVPTSAVLDLDEALRTDQITARKAFTNLPLGNGFEAPFPDGTLEIDGERMGIAGPAPVLETAIEWKPAPPRPQPDGGGERPFTGLKILDLGVIIVGAEGGRLFADMGADVIKIENPEFPDGSRQNRTKNLISPAFTMGHRNKRSLGVDLRSREGKALLMQLVAESDVVLSNFKGGTLTSLGLDYASLRKVNPAVILTDSSAFGPNGPWSRRLGYGPLVRASAGLTTQWVYPGEPESFSDAVTVYPDHVAGRLSVIGAIALLVRRLRTGQGGSVAVSQAEVMLSHMAAQIAARTLSNAGHTIKAWSAVERSDVYACAGEDEWCVLTIRDARDEAALAGVTGGQPVANWFSQTDSQDAMVALQRAKLAAAKLLRVSDLPDFPHFRDRRFFRTETHPHLPAPYIAERTPVRSERLPDPPMRPAPLTGEHTSEILTERFGFDSATIGRLREAGTVQQFEMPEPT